MHTEVRVKGNRIPVLTLFLVLLIFTSMSAYHSIQAQSVSMKPAFAQSSSDIFRFDTEIPATLIVGRNFTLSGSLTAFIDNESFEDVSLTIEGSNQLLIYGQRTVSLGPVYNSADEKSFSFTALPLEAGAIRITITAIGTIQSSKDIVAEEITITSTAVQASTTLSIRNVQLEGDAASRSLSITATVSNNGNFDAKDVIVSLNAQGSQLLDQSIKNIELIPTNSEITVTWTLQSVQTGTAQVSASASNAPAVTIAVPITFVQSEAQSQSRLSFSIPSFPANVVRDTSFEIPFTLINTASSAARDVFAIIEVPEGISILNNSTQYVGTIEPSGNFSSSFTVQASKTGSFNIKLTAHSSNNPSRSLPLTITANDPDIRLGITSVSTNPIYLYPGDTRDRITIEVRNFGDQDIIGLNTRLVLPDGMSPSWSGSDMFTLPVLPSSNKAPFLTMASQIATFHVGISRELSPGSYQVGLEMDDGFRNVTGYFTLVVMPKAAFLINDMSYSRLTLFGSESLTFVSPGSDNVIRATFFNNGSSAADSVVAQLQASNDFIGKGKTALTTGIVDSVGTVLRGQAFHATYQLSIDGTVSPGTYPATILLTWKQSGLSGDFTQTIPINITVGQKPIGDQIPYAQIFLASISAIFVGLYVVSKRKKTTEEKESNASDGQDKETKESSSTSLEQAPKSIVARIVGKIYPRSNVQHGD